MKHTQAYKIAKHDLAACIVPEGIIAGTHHFVDLWARDAFFATLGANVSGYPEASAQTINTFLHFRRPDGLVPYRIMRSPTSWAKYWGRPTYYKTPRPHFRSRQSGGIVPDGGLLVTIAAFEYGRRSGDHKSLFGWYDGLVSATQWYTARGSGRLIREWVQCEWADSNLKAGAVLYTNVLYWQALGDMARISEIVGRPREMKKFFAWQKSIGEAINAHFWNGEFFSDWIDWKRQDYFSSHANMLAVLFGLATKEQSKQIFAYAKEHCWNGWTLETNYPVYPFWRVQPLNYLVGMGDYHNRGCLWLQAGISYAVALGRTGETKEANRVLQGIAQKIVQYNHVYEVYEKTGAPLKRFLYRSEGPFAWSSGLYLWAYHILNNYD